MNYRMGKPPFVIVSLVFFLLVPDLASADWTSECGGNLDVENATFESPNYPSGPYGPNMTCTWIAEISGGMFLYFDQFYLDGSGDRITVEDENGFVGTYFGIQKPFIIQSFSDVLHITFISGNETSPNWSRQFSGIVKKECKIVYTFKPFGYIFTPLMLMQEQNASQTFTCTWQIANFVYKGIILSIQTADFTNSSANPNLLVYEGPPDRNGKLLGNFSAENPAHAVVTSNNEMYISLTYDILALPTLAGVYRTTTPECTKNVKVNVSDNKTTVISSLGYPIQYHNDMECWWLIESDTEDSTLGISVYDVNLSDDEDRLVFYSSANRSSKPLAAFGGSTTAQPFFVTEGNMMLVSFTTDDMGTAGGVSFEVFAQDMGGVIRPTDSDSITLKLEKNKRILYLLQTDDDLQPVVKQVQQTNYPTTGNLTIRFFQDSWKTGEPLIMQTPAQGIVPVIFSNSQSMFIYAEGFDEEKNGTSLTMQVTAAPSGTNLYSRNGMSDSFCGKSKENYWIINPSFEKGTNAMIELTFQDLPIRGGPAVTIEQGLFSTKSQNIASFTSNTKELAIHIPIGDAVRVSFVSAEKTPLPFYANYHIIDDCNEQADSSKSFGSLTSTHFPSAYPLNAVCDQTLKRSSTTEKIHLAFDTLKLAPSHSVTVRGTVFDATYMAGDLPNDILLNSANVSITLNSKMNLPIKNVATDQGYKIDFTILQCGGNMTTDKGKFSSPGFPKQSSASVTCIWIVTVPKPKGSILPSIVVLSVNGTQLKGQTKSNYIEIYDGPNVRSPMVNISTFKSEKTTFESRSQSIVIKYVNGKNKGFPFQMSYSTHNCGTTEVCDNGICLHESWRCDGIDQCGDSTDEQNCNSGLVTKKTLVLAVFGGMIATVVFIVVLAIVFVRYKRSKSYGRLDDSAIST